MNMTQSFSTSEKNTLGVSNKTANMVGDRLRLAREQKQLTPSQIAFRIKIRKLYVEAIEGGDWNVLPPGLNGRGFVRQYAKELGISLPEFEEFLYSPEQNVRTLSEETTFTPEEVLQSILPPQEKAPVITEHTTKATISSKILAFTPLTMFILFSIFALSAFVYLLYVSKHFA